MSKSIKIDPVKFVKLWMTGLSHKDMAKEFDCYESSISNFATRLRKLGVNLPKREPWEGSKNIDVILLNKIVKDNS